MKRFFIYAFLLSPLFSLAQSPGVKRTQQGATCNVVTANAGPRIKPDDVITFQVIQKTEKDSVLFSSYSVGHPVKLQVQPTRNVGDLMQVFQLLTAKDSAIVKVPSDSVFAGHDESRPQFLPKGSNMVFVIKIEKVQSLNDAIAERNAAMEKMKTEEKAGADKYISSHNLKLTATASGLKYAITRPSNKRRVMAGDTLYVNYAGRTVNDKLFDTSIETLARASGLNQPGRTYEPLRLVVGQGQVIRGWDEGLQLLSEGSKAIFVIPSDLGYGPQGAGDDIGPFSTLVFDVEVMRAIPAKIKPAAPPKKPVGKTTAKPAAKAPAKKPASVTTKKK